MRSVASFFRSCCKSDDAIECDKGAEKKAVKTHFASDLGGGVKVLNQKIPDVVVTPGPSALEGKMPHGCLVASELTPKQGSLNPFLFSNSLLLCQQPLFHKELSPSVDMGEVTKYVLRKYKQASVDMQAGVSSSCDVKSELKT